MLLDIFYFYNIIKDVKYSKTKVINKLKKICNKKKINNKNLFQLYIEIQDHIVCLYFDITPYEKTNISIYLSCGDIKNNSGIDIVSSFDINFKKNIADDNYITKYKSTKNNKYIERHGLFNIHFILILCRIFGVSKYIINDGSNIWYYNFIKYRKSYYERVGFVPLYKTKYNNAIKIINNLSVKEYKNLYYKKYKKYPKNISKLKKNKFINSLENLSNSNKEIFLSSLFMNLKLFSIGSLTELQYKFNKNKVYSKKYFDNYDMQYIEK